MSGCHRAEMAVPPAPTEQRLDIIAKGCRTNPTDKDCMGMMMDRCFQLAVEDCQRIFQRRCASHQLMPLRIPISLDAATSAEARK